MAEWLTVWGALSWWRWAAWVWLCAMTQCLVAVLCTTVSGAAERVWGGVGGWAM
jgi:hypothetical protein